MFIRPQNTEKSYRPSLAIFINSSLQKNIVMKLLGAMTEISLFGNMSIVSLEDYYLLGVEFDRQGIIKLNSLFKKPWYQRKVIIKLISLPQFVIQMLRLRRRFQYFMFFVDTGVLERCAIWLMSMLHGRTMVLQDAMKLTPVHANKRSLTWFGGGGADLYMLMGARFQHMIHQKDKAIVGSPIFPNKVSPVPLGSKILFVHQPFSLYRMTRKDEEFRFLQQTLDVAVDFGQVEFRLHPHQDISHYLHLASRQVEITQKKPLSESIKEARVMLTVNSSVILEALACGRPTITLEWHPTPFFHPIKTGIIPCRNVDELRRSLLGLESNAETNNYHKDGIQKELDDLVAFSGEDSIKKIIGTMADFVSNNRRQEILY